MNATAATARKSDPQAIPQSRMTLASVRRGKLDKPPRILVYGTEGVGKSTLGAGAPNPIFLAAEDGTGQLDVARFPEPRTWAEAKEAIATLTTEQHDYQTLVIDTLDWLEPMCWDYVCKRDKKDDIEAYGYGKGYVAALSEWREFVTLLDRLRAARGMIVVLLAHSMVKSFANPEDENYDRYEMKLHLRTGGLLKEWVDVVGFARYETLAAKKKGELKAKAVQTGARILHTNRTASYDAKNRYDLPDTLPLSWESLASAIVERKPDDPVKLAERIEALLAGSDDALATKVRASVVKAAGDAAQLARILDKLTATIGQKE